MISKSINNLIKAQCNSKTVYLELDSNLKAFLALLYLLIKQMLLPALNLLQPILNKAKNLKWRRQYSKQVELALN